MTLIKYNRPNSDLYSKRFSDIMDDFFSEAVSARRDSFVPGIDISETDKQFLIAVELPGMERKDIDISLENGRLTVSGERKFEKEEEGKTWHKVENKYGSFARTFQLPDNVDEESIDAKYKNGVLNISINKSKEKAKKQIEIS